MHKIKRRIILFLAVIVIAVLGVFAYIGNHYVTPVIMYHSVTPDAQAKNRLTVSVDTFRRQMQFLSRHKYNVISLEELTRLMRDKREIPAKTVAITFDDGYKDNYTFAYPILKEYGLKATIFVIIDEIGRSQNDRLSWDEVEEMSDSGLIAIGSHTLGPQPLTEIESEGEVVRQITESKRILEERLGKDIQAFSYPQGGFNEMIREAVIDAGYSVAVATNPGKDYPDDDPFALKRIRISETSRTMFVFWIETSGFYTFIKERRHK